jgi:hypothetical protein
MQPAAPTDEPTGAATRASAQAPGPISSTTAANTLSTVSSAEAVKKFNAELQTTIDCVDWANVEL